MKSIVAAGLFFACLHTLAAEQIEDGFYLAVKESETKIADQDGNRVPMVPVGQKQKLKINDGQITSGNNSNTRFSLYLNVPYDKNIDTGTYVLVVDGTAIKQNGCGSGQDTSNIYFNLNNRRIAEKAAEFLGVPLHLRKHPGHKLHVTLTPSKEVYAPGEEVEVTMRIVNVGTDAIAFMVGGRQRATRDNQYIFSAYNNGKQVEDIGTTNHFGGQAYRKVLQPEEAFESKISLNKWFAFDEPGFYSVHGSYYMSFVDVEGDRFATVWDDFVSAGFYFRVEKHGEE